MNTLDFILIMSYKRTRDIFKKSNKEKFKILRYYIYCFVCLFGRVSLTLTLRKTTIWQFAINKNMRSLKFVLGEGVGRAFSLIINSCSIELRKGPVQTKQDSDYLPNKYSYSYQINSYRSHKDQMNRNESAK